MAKFEVYPDASGSYRWRLVAANGTKIASSGESFASRENAKRAAETVKREAGGASGPQQQRKSPLGGRYRARPRLITT